jgi:hypothetical protein
MSDWWTYSLSDFLLFSPRTYYRLFELYNLAIWPMQLLAFAGGFAILWAWHRGGAAHGRIIAGVLVAFWLWVAWAYLLGHYDTINWAARYAALGFALQALLLAWVGLGRNRLRLRWWRDAGSRIGLGVFIFALAIQPLSGPRGPSSRSHSPGVRSAARRCGPCNRPTPSSCRPRRCWSWL